MPNWSFQDSEWRQGAVIPQELVPEGLLPRDLDQAAKLVVISHDCDIVQPSYSAEPFVELLIAKPVTAEDKNGALFRGRNPRRLQFWLGTGEDRKLYEISAHDRLRMDRQALENHQPDRSLILDVRTIATIANWYAKRYNRSSFPTAFNKRIPAAKWKKIKKSLERDGDDVLIFMGLNSFDELPNDRPYQVLIRVVVPSEALENDLREQKALNVVAMLRANLADCHGIELVEVNLESEADFSLEDLNSTIEWDTFGYLSVPSDDPETSLS